MEDIKAAIGEEIIEETVDKEEYVPRNSVVAAKENIYSKVNITVKQVDRFIIGCIAVIALLIFAGIAM